MSQLLLRGSGSSVSAEAKARLPAALIEIGQTNDDTRFDSLKSDFTIEPAAFSSDNLSSHARIHSHRRRLVRLRPHD